MYVISFTVPYLTLPYLTLPYLTLPYLTLLYVSSALPLVDDLFRCLLWLSSFLIYQIIIFRFSYLIIADALMTRRHSSRK